MKDLERQSLLDYLEEADDENLWEKIQVLAIVMMTLLIVSIGNIDIEQSGNNDDVGIDNMNISIESNSDGSYHESNEDLSLNMRGPFHY